MDRLKKAFEEAYQKSPEYIFSAPGRTELGGNHTDHQHGRVLAAAVNLDTRAAVAPNGENIIRIQSEGYPMFSISTDDLAVNSAESGTSAALVRGVAARIKELTGKCMGFDACVVSSVLPGSGLSSSAAFEVLMGTILNHLCTCGLSPVEIAQVGQYAENVYFGKPCGLMDQTASSVGGIVTIDFEDTAAPVVEPIDFDFSACGYDLCIIDSGADHSDLTDEYASIPGELEKASRVFGRQWLRQIPESEFFTRIPQVRAAAGDRAVLRAIHIYEDNVRVEKQVEALRRGDMESFLRLVTDSGRSSWMYLQNVIPTGNSGHQELALALGVTDRLLDGKGAFRVHGGGFAGTLQAFVPRDMTADFKEKIERILGAGKCHVLSIRREGGVLLEKIG